MKNKVIAILTADWHLSHNPPVWRSVEPDWYEAMKRPLKEIEELRNKHNCPILCAGDIFDKWNSPAELINFALVWLPHHINAIPGQHDLPEHNLDNIHRSAYETLNRASRINGLSPAHKAWMDLTTFNDNKNFRVSPFPFGIEIKSAAGLENKSYIKTALIHDYVWHNKYRYPNAPMEKNITLQKKNKFIDNKLYGYDVIVYGDNHKGFLTKVGDTTIFNCGTLMRRKSDEINYKPQVGLLYSDSSVEPHYLDVSKDKHLTASQTKNLVEQSGIDFKQFAKEMAELGDSDLDFKEAWEHYYQINKLSKEIKSIVREAMTNESI